MRNLLMIGLLCLTFSACQETFAQETTKTEATLDETMSWLQTKFRTLSLSIFGRGTEEEENPVSFVVLRGFKSKSVEFKDCRMYFDTDYKSGQFFYLKDVDSARIRMFAIDDGVSWSIELYQKDMESNKFIGLSTKESGTGLPLTQRRILFRFSENITDRVSTALKHAIKLCGGDTKKEAF